MPRVNNKNPGSCGFYSTIIDSLTTPFFSKNVYRNKGREYENFNVDAMNDVH